MDRRWVGIGAVLLAVAAAVVLPNVDGRAVAGRAQAIPVDGPPAVGDCVLDPVPRPEQIFSSGGPSFVTGRTGACSGTRFGEIAGIVPDVLPEMPTPASTPSAAEGPTFELIVGDEQFEQCGISHAQYLGVPLDMTTMQVRPEFTYWSLATSASLAFYAPTERQQAAGQRWVACVVHPYVVPGVGETGYRHSVRDKSKPLPEPFASCADSYSQLFGWEPAPCDAPHRVEILGFGYQPDELDKATQEDLDATCTALAVQRTGITDLPTHPGLQITAPASHAATDGSRGLSQAEGLGDPGSQERSAGCIVTATGPAELTGTLVGLGHRPIPWA